MKTAYYLNYVYSRNKTNLFDLIAERVAGVICALTS